MKKLKAKSFKNISLEELINEVQDNENGKCTFFQ